MREPAQLRGERTAAVLLLGGGPVAALAALGTCLLAAVLVPLDLWRPLIVAPMLLPVAVVVWRLARWVPARSGPPVPVWSAAAVLLIAAGFAVWAGATHGEHLVLRRDAGSYALFAHWLATHHGLPVDAHLQAFGGTAALAVPGFTMDSPAYYQVTAGHGIEIVPQFLLGAPAMYSAGWWLDGWTGLFVVPAVLGGLAVLAAGGLAARVVGPRWAPLAAGGLALTQPMLHASRAPFSEPAAALLVLGAAALAVDALTVRAPAVPPPALGALAEASVRQQRRLAVLAGATAGLAGLVRVDSVREVALLLPVCAALAARRHPAGLPLGVSALAGTAVSAAPALWLSRPYLHTVSGSLVPLVDATVALAALCAVAVPAHRRLAPRLAGRLGTPGRLDRALPPLGAALVAAALVLLASRPLWTVARTTADDPSDPLVASLQQAQGLPVDGTRTYAERSVEWVVWYVGLPAALAAAAALVAAGFVAVRWWRRSLGAEPAPPPRWLVPAVVGLGSAVLTLYRPGITPDHPWADRRLVPVVLPLAMVAATAAVAWTVRWARRRLPAVLLVAVGVTAVLAMVVPAAQATAPLARARTELGEPAAVAAVCAELRPGDAVVGIADAAGDIRAQNEWLQVVRGVCGHPSAALLSADDGGASGKSAAPGTAELDRLAALASGAGGRLVLLSASEDDGSAQQALAALGLQPRHAVLLHTTEDQHLLTRRPFDRSPLVIDVWLAVWRRAGGG